MEGIMYLEPGQKINTTIITISKDSVFLDLNAKSEGILPLADIQNEDGTLTAREGDSIDVYFIGTMAPNRLSIYAEVVCTLRDTRYARYLAHQIALNLI